MFDSAQPVRGDGTITVYRGDVGAALRRLRKASGMRLRDWKKHQSFLSPSQKRRRKSTDARARARRAAQRQAAAERRLPARERAA